MNLSFFLTQNRNTMSKNSWCITCDNPLGVNPLPGYKMSCDRCSSLPLKVLIAKPSLVEALIVDDFNMAMSFISDTKFNPTVNDNKIIRDACFLWSHQSC